ncbi:MAG: hypothetical protein WD009_09560 [Phycisphaeraceae bacterium]
MERMNAGGCAMSRAAVIDRYFLEHRAKLLDVAAFLDRVDRATPGSEEAEDYRVAALRRAMAVLLEREPGRARRVQEALSDPTREPITSAAGMKGAAGAWRGEAGTGG